MFFVDTVALRGKMGERRCNVTQLANAIGISRNTLSHYMENPRKFPYPIMIGIATELNLNYGEAQAIFFKQKLT